VDSDTSTSDTLLLFATGKGGKHAAIAKASDRKLTEFRRALDGVLLDFHAMQGGGPTVAETAILKAKTAVHWQRSTKTLEQDVTMGRNQASLWINDFPKAGALPIMIDGQVAGAIGVGGAQKQEECAQVGIDAVIPKQPVAAQR